MVAEEGRGNAFPADSSVSSESDGQNDGIDLEEREKHLVQSNLDEQDVDLSLAFVNINDRVADNTWVKLVYAIGSTLLFEKDAEVICSNVVSEFYSK